MSATAADTLHRDLGERGYAVLPRFADAAACDALAAMFDDDALFRSTIVMERHGYGRGTYRYFRYPLPSLVATLRERVYGDVVSIANAWSEQLAQSERYPSTLDEMLARAHAAGQTRPTPLLLRYDAGDYNALHQDMYGSVAFPFQATVMLSEPNRDFSGGEFTLVESRPRKQSVAHVVTLALGDAVIFPNRQRPNARGGRSTFRHGVSPLRSGRRTTLGLILHDAQ